jgi:hypothetical protein
MDRYYNRGALQAVLDSDVILKSVFYTDLVADQREYKLSPSHWKIESAQYIATADTDIREMRYMSRNEYRNWILRDEDATGEPTHYYFWRKLGDSPEPTTAQPPSIFLHPTPGTAEAGTANLRLYTYKYPDLIDSEGSPGVVVELEPPYVEAALMYAASMVKADDGEMGESNAFLARYEAQIDKVRSSLAREDRSRFSRIMPKGSRDAYHQMWPIRW